MNSGKKLQKLRKKNNYSQEELAELIGVVRQTLSKWELGETSPDLKQATILSKTLNVSLEKLINNKQEVKHTNKESKSLVNIIGLFFIDFIAFLFFVIILLLIISLFLFSISCIAVGGCILLKINFANIIPMIPYYCGIPISLTLFSLSIVSIITLIIIKKLLSKYIYLVKKYNYDILLIKNNDNVPSTSLSKKQKNILKIALICFCTFLIISIVSCIISAKDLAFYHKWNWFN